MADSMYAELEQLDQAVENPGGPLGLQAALVERGRFKVQCGIAQGGLDDLLRAYIAALAAPQAAATAMHAPPLDATFDDRFQQFLEPANLEVPDSASVAQLAYMGEALRVYARDVLLSVEEKEPQVESTASKCIQCFNAAEERANKESDQGKKNGYLAWIFAHRAAVYMMQYWLLFVKNVNNSDSAAQNDVFNSSEAGFTHALELKSDYPWCVQFKAFLYALRAHKNDFETAANLLAPLSDGTVPSVRQASILRSIAMLYSYSAVRTRDYSPDPAQMRKAAQSSVDAGLKSMMIDPDEFLGGYSAAVSRWAIYDMDLAEAASNRLPNDQCNRDRVNLQEALDTSETRSRNSISQALATLMGIAYVRARVSESASERAELIAHAKAIEDLFKDFAPDLETRAMFIRDPAYHAISQAPIDPLKKAMNDCASLRTRKFNVQNNTKRRRISPWKM